MQDIWDVSADNQWPWLELVVSDLDLLSDIKLYHLWLYYRYDLNIGYSCNSQTVPSGKCQGIVLLVCDCFLLDFGIKFVELINWLILRGWSRMVETAVLQWYLAWPNGAEIWPVVSCQVTSVCLTKGQWLTSLWHTYTKPRHLYHNVQVWNGLAVQKQYCPWFNL